MAVFIVLWPYLLITKLKCLQKKKTVGHTNGGYGHHGGYEVCCENGVDFGTLLALLGGKPEQIFSYLCF